MLLVPFNWILSAAISSRQRIKLFIHVTSLMRRITRIWWKIKTFKVFIHPNHNVGIWHKFRLAWTALQEACLPRYWSKDCLYPARIFFQRHLRLWAIKLALYSLRQGGKCYLWEALRVMNNYFRELSSGMDSHCNITHGLSHRVNIHLAHSWHNRYHDFDK